MVTVRPATLQDVDGIREVFLAEYGDHYAYPQYCNRDALARLVFTDGAILLVAIEDQSERVVGTASVVFSVGAYNDLVGEFGRLVVHPDFRGRGIGAQLMQARIDHVAPRLHVGIVENRVAHMLSQKISHRFQFVPVGLQPMKLMLSRRESVAMFVQYFGDALSLRRNNPRIIPEVGQLAGLALEHCELPADCIIDDSSPPFLHCDEFALEELRTEGYASLLRIERGRIRNREVFGPVRLHYGFFHLRATHSHYLIARHDNQIAGGIGYTWDETEKAVRIFELISRSDRPIRFLIKALIDRCQSVLGVEYIEVDVSAYAPRMQRTLLELGFLPVSYVPAHVFHEVERLDVVKMSRILVPFDLGDVYFIDPVKPVAEFVIKSFTDRSAHPRIAAGLSGARLLTGLSDEQRQRLLEVCELRTFEPEETIYCQGSTEGDVHVLLKGEVELAEANSRHVANVGPGFLLGETILLQTSVSAHGHSLCATAKTNVETAAVSDQEFHALVRRRPDIGLVIYRNIAADISAKLNASRGHQPLDDASETVE